MTNAAQWTAVKLPKEIYEVLSARAKEEERAISVTLKRAIRAYINKQEGKA